MKPKQKIPIKRMDCNRRKSVSELILETEDPTDDEVLPDSI